MLRICPIKIGVVLIGFAWLTGCSPVSVEQQQELLAIPKQEPVSPVEIQLPSETPDFSAIRSVKQRKRSFFDYMRPFYQRAAMDIQKDRRQLKQLMVYMQLGQSLDQTQQQWLQDTAKHYGVNKEPQNIAQMKALLERVDVLPEALVLSQAANESSYGRSRFARQGNNYFGQWCYRQGCGLVPLERSSGAVHEVKVFTSTYDSVKAYMDNVNTHSAYQELRDIRARLREEGKPLDPMQLAEGLKHYSERGEAYVLSIQQFIRINQRYWQDSST